MDPREGNLAQTSTSDLISHVEPVRVEVGHTDHYESALIPQSGFNQSLPLMSILVVLLLGEQLLAYFTSYHPSRKADNRARGRPGWRAAIERLRDASEASAARAAAPLGFPAPSGRRDVPPASPTPDPVPGARR